MKTHRLRSLSMIAVAGAMLVSLTGCTTPSNVYVALGDSYTAGPLIPDQSLAPLGCLRSDHNYPSLVAPMIGQSSFTDVSCSGAETNEMFNAQNVTPGPANPPQLSAITSATKVVTIGIGGNDIGFSSIVEGCVNLNPFATPCKDSYVTSSGDELAQRIAATGPKIAAVLQGAHANGPNAKIFLIGYPDILPTSGNGCWPTVPILPADIPYLNNTEKELNAMLASEAAANNATFIDVYTPTIGHDVCSGSSNQYIEGIIPGTSAAPVHPNAAAMQAEANVIGPIIKKATGL